MCRKVAHKASAAAGTVAATVGDTSVRVADGIVSRMGNSNYGRLVVFLFGTTKAENKCCVPGYMDPVAQLQIFSRSAWDKMLLLHGLVHSISPCTHFIDCDEVYSFTFDRNSGLLPCSISSYTNSRLASRMLLPKSM